MSGSASPEGDVARDGIADGAGAEAPVRRTRRRSRRRRTWPQRLVLATGVLATVGFAAGAAGLGYAYRKVEQLPRVELSHVLDSPVSRDAPRNVLLVGLDYAGNLDSDDPVRRGRDPHTLADTIMILRIDPGEQQAALLSIPRDLWVTFPATQVQSRINTAIMRGDGRPDLLIEVLNDYLDIPIHNYVQLDFAGFKDLVEVIGGVPVYIEHPMRDQHSGFRQEEPGCVTLDPDRALAYVRSRFVFYEIDGRWQSEGRSDLARVERQQDFLRRTADRAVSRGARNLGTLNTMVNAAIASVTVDDELTLRDMRSLAERFRSFDPGALETYVLPVEDDTVGTAQVVRLDEHEAASVLALFRDVPSVGDDDLGPDGGVVRPGSDHDDGAGGGRIDGSDREVDPELVPGQVSLTVLNGSGEAGQAGLAGGELNQVGFGIVSRDNAAQFGTERTEIRYPEGEAAAADLVERWLVAGADLVETDEVSGVTVVTGADWSGVRSVARSPSTAGDGPTLAWPEEHRLGGGGSATLPGEEERDWRDLPAGAEGDEGPSRVATTDEGDAPDDDATDDDASAPEQSSASRRAC